LARSIIGQAAWIVGAAAVVAVSFAVGVGWIADKVTQNVSLAIEGVSLLRVAAGAAVLAVVGGLIPLLKVARIDPASVFRR
jgi:ABC-type antimicrobial peptide transport system permease subunit